MAKRKEIRREKPFADKDIPAIDAIRGQGPLSRTPLYRWMWDNFDIIESSRTGRPDWTTATEEFIKMGFTARGGTPLNPASVRKMWERVSRDKTKV